MMLTIIVFLLCGAFFQTTAGDNLYELSISPSGFENAEAGKSVLITCSYTTADFRNVAFYGPNDNLLNTTVPGVMEIDNDVKGETTNIYLTFNSISRSDGGKYICKGDFVKNVNTTENVEVTLEVDVYDPIRITDTPTYQEIIRGQSQIVTCSVTGEPQPTVTWNKDGKKLKMDNQKYLVENKSFNLIIRDVEDSDEGTYECVIREIKNGQSDDLLIEVAVIVKATIVDFEPQRVAVEGEPFQLTCNATGRPEITYTWFKTGDDIFSLSELTNGLSEDGTILTISNVTKEDAGNYTCIAETKAGRDEAAVSVTVYVKPMITSKIEDTVKVGSNAKLHCQATGDPEPEVVFVRSGQVINENDEDSRYKVTYVNNAAQLLIDETVYDDVGEYTCRATNDAGEAEDSLYLDIQYAPKPTELQSMYACPNELATLECKFDANPPATLSWGRYIPGEMGGVFTNVDYSMTSESGGVLYLQVNASDDDAFKNYTCLAINDIGENEAVARLIPATVSSPPTNLMNVDINTRNATISFEPPMQKNVQLSKYVIDLSPPTDETNTDPVPANNKFFNLIDLEPDTVYTVSLTAVNCMGDGMASVPYEFKTKAIGKPEAVEVISGRNAMAHDEYNLKWRLKDAAGGAFQKLVIEVKKVEEGIDGKVEETVQATTLLKNDSRFLEHQYTISDLEPATKYKIILTAHNEVDSSEEMFQFTTNLKQLEMTTQADLDINAGGVNGVLIGIIVAIMLLLLILLDCVCFCTRKWGVTMYIYMHTCGKGKAKSKDIEGGSTDVKASNLTPISENPVNDNEAAPLKGADNAAAATNGETKDKAEENIKNLSPAQEEQKSLIANASDSKAAEGNNATA